MVVYFTNISYLLLYHVRLMVLVLIYFKIFIDAHFLTLAVWIDGLGHSPSH